MKDWIDDDSCELRIRSTYKLNHEVGTCRFTINGNNFDAETLEVLDDIIGELTAIRGKWAEQIATAKARTST